MKQNVGLDADTATEPKTIPPAVFKNRREVKHLPVQPQMACWSGDMDTCARGV